MGVYAGRAALRCSAGPILLLKAPFATGSVDRTNGSYSIRVNSWAIRADIPEKYHDYIEK